MVKPCDDPGLSAMRNLRHSILARPTDVDCVAEMWGRGLEYADRLASLHAPALEHLVLSRQAPLPALVVEHPPVEEALPCGILGPDGVRLR
jgi:hypothetical protein